MGVLPRVRAFYDPAFGRIQGRRPILSGDLRDEPALQQALRGGLRVVAAIEVDGRALRRQAERPGGVQQRSQERRVVVVGRGRNEPEREAPARRRPPNA